MRLPEDAVGNVIQPGDIAVESSVMAMVSGTVMFTISGGVIDIIGLRSTMQTDNTSLAATLQYKFTPTVGSGQAISGASAALSNILTGGAVDMLPNSLTSAPTITLAGSGAVMPMPSTAGRIRVGAGTITPVFATSSATCTWKNNMRYAPLSPLSIVV